MSVVCSDDHIDDSRQICTYILSLRSAVSVWDQRYISLEMYLIHCTRTRYFIHTVCMKPAIHRVRTRGMHRRLQAYPSQYLHTVHVQQCCQLAERHLISRSSKVQMWCTCRQRQHVNFKWTMLFMIDIIRQSAADEVLLLYLASAWTSHQYAWCRLVPVLTPWEEQSTFLLP